MGANHSQWKTAESEAGSQLGKVTVLVMICPGGTSPDSDGE